MTSKRSESVKVEHRDESAGLTGDQKSNPQLLCNYSRTLDKYPILPSLKMATGVSSFVREYMYCFENNLRENDSVKRTIGAIISHPWVMSILETEKYDYDDMKGRDLIVQLYNSKKRHIPGDTVFVQVKSSWTGVREFIRSKSVKKRIDWTDFRQSERMVLLNGQHDDELIRDSFAAQLRRIHTYYS